jgi:hypothetical protein
MTTAFDPHLTAMATIWGQFVANDISYTLPLSGYEKVRRACQPRELHTMPTL